MTFDVNRLKFGDMIAAGGALLLFISMFLDWYSVEVEGFGGNELDLGGGNAWDLLEVGRFLLLLLVLATIAVVVMRALGTGIQGLPVPLSTILLGLAALTLLYILFRLINPPGESADGVDVGRGIGIFLGLLSTLAIAAGAFLSARERGEAVPGVGGAGVGSPLGGGQPGGPLGGGQPYGGGQDPYGAGQQPVGGQPAGGATAVGTPSAGDPAAGGGATQVGGAGAGGAQAGGAPKADWYPDPEGKARLRYWDGTQWTDQTAD